MDSIYFMGVKRMNKKRVTEIVEFRFIPGISDEECVRIVDTLEEKFHSRQKGFIDTELAKGKDNQWMIVQHWASMEDVKAVVKLMMKEAATEEYRESIDPTSVKIQLLEQIQIWN